MNTGDNAILRFLLFLPVLFICGTAKSQVVGTIIDSSSLEPVAGAYVSGYFSSRLVAQAFSDDDGAFILDSGWKRPRVTRLFLPSLLYAE